MPDPFDPPSELVPSPEQEESVTHRILHLFLTLLLLTLWMYAVWALSSLLLPQRILRGFFSARFSSVVQEMTFGRIFLANFTAGFLGVQFMNLFRVGRRSGGLFILVIFWSIYGLLLGTDSFVLAAAPSRITITILWARTGFSELAAYTFGYEASRKWALWQQEGVWSVPHRLPTPWRLRGIELIFWVCGLALLVAAVWREVYTS